MSSMDDIVHSFRLLRNVASLPVATPLTEKLLVYKEKAFVSDRQREVLRRIEAKVYAT
jgi:hypothetical protein